MKKRNILLFIADDVGVDQIPWYIDYYTRAGHPITVYSPPNNRSVALPVVGKLTQAGVTFVNAWSSPVCSPTRACLYTGDNCFRHGVYSPEATGAVLPETINGATTTTIPSVLKNAGYGNGLFGKWHLGGNDPCSGSTVSAPVHFGWGQFCGAYGGGLSSYTNWQRIVDNGTGAATCETNGYYATRVNVSDAFDWISKQSNPWMATVAFNAPHEPWDSRAPSDYASRNDPTHEDLMYYRSNLEYVDLCMGELLAKIAPDVLENTTIIFMGDNGTPGTITTHFGSRAKDSIYQGGVNVPLIIADGYSYLHPGRASSEIRTGRVVSPGRTELALVQTLDIFATCAEIGNGDARSGVDSVSMVPYLETTFAPPRRQFVFAEHRPSSYVPGGAWPSGNCDWDVAVAANIGPGGHPMKLVLKDYNLATGDSNSTCSGTARELYDLVNDPWESINLLSGKPLDPPEVKTLKEMITTLVHS